MTVGRPLVWSSASGRKATRWDVPTPTVLVSALICIAKYSRQEWPGFGRGLWLLNLSAIIFVIVYIFYPIKVGLLPATEEASMRLWQRSIQWQLILSMGAALLTSILIVVGIYSAVVNRLTERDLIGDVLATSERLRTAVGQVARVVENIAGRAGQQQEMTVQEIARNASNAAQSSHSARNEAQGARQVVGQSIAHIEASPPAWPCSSLTFLKKSISISTSDSGSPWRTALATWLGSRLLN